MAYTKSADGVASKGKTDAKVYPNSGPTASNPKGGKGGKCGPTGQQMRAVGRNMARANNQRGG
jgi:hypothetical protein